MYSALVAFLFDDVIIASIFDDWLDSESELEPASFACSENVNPMFSDCVSVSSGTAAATWFVSELSKTEPESESNSDSQSSFSNSCSSI